MRLVQPVGFARPGLAQPWHADAMYVPQHFSMPEADITAMLAEITVADLVSAGPDGMVATLLPLLYDAESHSLQGHVARTNTQWRATADEALAIVHGPDAYVSPSSYASKAEHGRVVPTWNYLTLHIYGTLSAHEDPEWLRGHVTRLTNRHEAARPQPWQVDDAPAEYLSGQLRAIVGLTLSISRIEAKAKLSQNRSLADQHGVVDDLSERGEAAQALGSAMSRAWR